MKQCLKCNKQYDDSKMFCPVCGEKLETAASSSENETKSKVTNALGGNGNQQFEGLQQWSGTILAAVGLLVEWEWSIFFGMVLAVCGAVLGYKSPNQINKGAAIVIGVISLILYVAYA